MARRSWTARQLPANRRDRDRLLAGRRAGRVVVDLTVVALAFAAASAVRGRGLVQTQSQHVDLLLAAAPVLLAAAATVVLVRVFPPVLRLAARVAAHRRGPVPLVAMARATRTESVGLPLLSMTIALGLVVFSGVLAASTLSGQERASAEIVGAEVRVDGTTPASAPESLRAQPGVEAVAHGRQVHEVAFNPGSFLYVTFIGVDAAEYDAILERRDERYHGELAGLVGTSAGGKVRAVISPDLVAHVAERGSTIGYGEKAVPLDVVGTTDIGGPGAAEVIVDLTSFNAVSTTPLVADMLWVDGPGADDAVAAAAHEWPDATVITRTGWIAHLRNSPLVGGLLALMTAGALVLATFASITLVLTVVATSRERGRTLSALRTLGLGRRAARRVTLTELTPLVVGAVLTGCAIGVGLPWALSDALGLDLLTGERSGSRMLLTPWPFVLAVGACVLALVLSVGVEALVRRGDNLGQVLRVGER